MQQESLNSYQALTLSGMRARSQGKVAKGRGRMYFYLWPRKKNERMKENSTMLTLRRNVISQALTNYNTNSFFQDTSSWGPFSLAKLKKYWSFLISGPQHFGVSEKRYKETNMVVLMFTLWEAPTWTSEKIAPLLPGFFNAVY